MPEIKGPTKWGDFSYGTYVLHYPIVQTLIALGFFQRSPWGTVALVVCLVIVAAVFSWYGVERRWLQHGPAKRIVITPQPAAEVVPS